MTAPTLPLPLTRLIHHTVAAVLWLDIICVRERRHKTALV